METAGTRSRDAKIGNGDGSGDARERPWGGVGWGGGGVESVGGDARLLRHGGSCRAGGAEAVLGWIGRGQEGLEEEDARKLRRSEERRVGKECSW